MSTISFRNTPITIGGTPIIATQGTVAESVGLERVEGLGRSNVSQILSERQTTTFSAEFYIDATSYSKILAYTGVTQFSAKIAGTTISGLYLTQTSLNVDPNSLIRGSLNATSFDSQNWDFSSQTPSGMPEAKNTLAHGISTTIGGITGDFRSLTLDVSQNITPQYEIGSSSLIGVRYDGGEITASVEGFAPLNRASQICADTTGVNLTLQSMCNDSIGSINITGFRVRTSNVTVSVGEDLVGSMELVRYF